MDPENREGTVRLTQENKGNGIARTYEVWRGGRWVRLQSEEDVEDALAQAPVVIPASYAKQPGGGRIYVDPK